VIRCCRRRLRRPSFRKHSRWALLHLSCPSVVPGSRGQGPTS